MTPSDERLILYHYDDGLEAGERESIAAALLADRALRRRLDALVADLAAADVSTAPPSDAARRRWHAVIADASRDAPTPVEARRSARPRQALALAAMLLVGIGIGVVVDRDGAPSQAPSRAPTIAGQTPEATTEAGPEATVEETLEETPGTAPAASTTGRDRRVFERGLAVHLRDARARLAALDGDTGTVGTTARAALLLDVLEDNRLHERAARRSGAEDLARILRALDAVLVRLVAEKVGPAEADALRGQLAFELDATLVHLAPRTTSL